MPQPQKAQQGTIPSETTVQPPPEQLTTKYALEKIRPELNLEKWPIWQPAKSKNRPAERIIEREISLPGGNKLSARVEIGFTNRGDLTTEDQRTYYALVKQWEESGRPEQYTFFSLRHLAKRLRKKWGSNVITALTESLIRLRTTPFIWRNSYYDGTTRETIKVLDTFNIVSDLRIVRREQDGVVNKEVGYFKFNDFALRNLLTNHTKPVLFDTVLGFRSEIAQMLYTYLDLILADKSHFERRSSELFSDLGLRGRAYRNVSNRKQILERALKELQGVPLSTGVISLATLEKTKDEKDYKIVFKKSRRSAALALNPAEDNLENRRDSQLLVQPKSPKPESEIMKQAEDLVAYFYTLFHPEVKKTYFTSKAIAQAVSLIASHGYQQAHFMVEFSASAAPKTNYHPQSFGGVLQYTSRALARFEEITKAQTRREIIESCSFCSNTGFRAVGNNTVRQCTHDPNIEV